MTTTAPTIPNFRGMQMPNIEGLGFKREMREAAQLIREQRELCERMNRLGNQRQKLQEEIRQRESQLPQAWGLAIRRGEEEPSVAQEKQKIEKLRGALEDVKQEYAGVQNAAAAADVELTQTVQTFAAQWAPLVERAGTKKLEEAAQHFAKGVAVLAEVDPLVGLLTWLQSGARTYTPPTPASVSIEPLLEERRQHLRLASGEGSGGGSLGPAVEVLG